MPEKTTSEMAQEFALLWAEKYNWSTGPDPNKKPTVQYRDVSDFYERVVCQNILPRVQGMSFPQKIENGASELAKGRPLIKCIAQEALFASYMCLSGQYTPGQAKKEFGDILSETNAKSLFFLTPEHPLYGRGQATPESRDIRVLKMGNNEGKALRWFLKQPDMESFLLPEFLSQEESGVSQFVPQLRQRIAQVLDEQERLPSSERVPEQHLRDRLFADIVNEWEKVNMQYGPQKLNDEQNALVRVLGHSDLDGFVSYFDALPPDRYSQYARMCVKRLEGNPIFPEKKLEAKFALLMDHLIMDRILDPRPHRFRQAIPLIDLWNELMKEGGILPFERNNTGLLMSAVMAKEELLYPQNPFFAEHTLLRSAQSLREIIFVPKA